MDAQAFIGFWERLAAPARALVQFDVDRIPAMLESVKAFLYERALLVVQAAMRRGDGLLIVYSADCTPLPTQERICPKNSYVNQMIILKKDGRKEKAVFN